MEVQKVPTDRIKAGDEGFVPRDKPLDSHKVTVVDCGELPAVGRGLHSSTFQLYLSRF